MMRQIFHSIKHREATDSRVELYRRLLQHEAQIGGRLFGPTPDGVRREFFCLDEHTWVWHEEWTDRTGVRRIKTTRYDVREDGVRKAQDGQTYHPISGEEAENFRHAVELYVEQVHAELYNFA